MEQHPVVAGLPAIATTKEVAAFIQIEEDTLAYWRSPRSPKTGPPFFSLGGRAGIRYRSADVHQWIAEQIKIPA